MPITIAAELAELRSRSLLREMRELESPQQPAMEFAGKKLLNFSSNDYLGLATEPALREAAKVAIDQYGVGSGSSRLVCGTLTPHVRLEEKLAEFKRTEAALSFTSGYAAALGTIGALVRKDDVVILDKLCHASLLDGARLSGAAVRIFPHNHLGKLESHLQWARDNFPDARVLVVTESVFSMDGDWSLLAEIVEMKDRYGALLLLDEAHAVGVIGVNGRGLADHLGLSAKIDLHMGTMSKALGTIGGYVCARRTLIRSAHQSRAELHLLDCARARLRLGRLRRDRFPAFASRRKKAPTSARQSPPFRRGDAAAFSRRAENSKCDHSAHHRLRGCRTVGLRANERPRIFRARHSLPNGAP